MPKTPSSPSKAASKKSSASPARSTQHPLFGKNYSPWMAFVAVVVLLQVLAAGLLQPYGNSRLTIFPYGLFTTPGVGLKDEHIKTMPVAGMQSEISFSFQSTWPAYYTFARNLPKPLQGVVSGHSAIALNLICWVLSVVLTWHLARRFSGQGRAAGIATLIFALSSFGWVLAAGEVTANFITLAVLVMASLTASAVFSRKIARNAFAARTIGAGFVLGFFGVGADVSAALALPLLLLPWVLIRPRRLSGVLYSLAGFALGVGMMILITYYWLYLPGCSPKKLWAYLVYLTSNYPIRAMGLVGFMLLLLWGVASQKSARQDLFWRMMCVYAVGVVVACALFVPPSSLIYALSPLEAALGGGEVRMPAPYHGWDSRSIVHIVPWVLAFVLPLSLLLADKSAGGKKVSQGIIFLLVAPLTYIVLLAPTAGGFSLWSHYGLFVPIMPFAACLAGFALAQLAAECSRNTAQKTLMIALALGVAAALAPMFDDKTSVECCIAYVLALALAISLLLPRAGRKGLSILALGLLAASLSYSATSITVRDFAKNTYTLFWKEEAWQTKLRVKLSSMQSPLVLTTLPRRLDADAFQVMRSIYTRRGTMVVYNYRLRKQETYAQMIDGSLQALKPVFVLIPQKSARLLDATKYRIKQHGSMKIGKAMFGFYRLLPADAAQEAITEKKDAKASDKKPDAKKETVKKKPEATQKTQKLPAEHRRPAPEQLIHKAQPQQPKKH